MLFTVGDPQVVPVSGLCLPPGSHLHQRSSTLRLLDRRKGNHTYVASQVNSTSKLNHFVEVPFLPIQLRLIKCKNPIWPCEPCLNNTPASTSGPVRRLSLLFSQGAGCSGTELGVGVVSSQPSPSSSSLCLFSLFLQVSLVGFLFLLGLYISSLASCMGGLYGAPRILQCIAQERVIPALAFLGRGVGV